MKLAILTAALLASCSPVYAQERCGPTGDVYSMLLEDYNEQRLFVGRAGDAIVEMWGNPETDTWSMIVTRPDGISCAPAVGVGWETLPVVTGDPA